MSFLRHYVRWPDGSMPITKEAHDHLMSTGNYQYVMRDESVEIIELRSARHKK